MFTGIIETLGRVENFSKEGTNIHFEISSPISKELKIDQSIAHNGVCLTVTAVKPVENRHLVTAIEETLLKTSLRELEKGSLINLERAMSANGRFDGHVVQGHVDQTAQCTQIEDRDGSKLITFRTPAAGMGMIVEKGSVCIDGISLTVATCRAESNDYYFSVATIPYTWAHTNLKQLTEGSVVNIEFDIIGKYVEAALMKMQGMKVSGS